MSPALRDFALVWRAALATRHPYAHVWVSVSALLFALFVGALVFVKSGDMLETLVYGLRAASVLLMLGVLMYFIPGAIKLNTPANAVLVPRVRCRARQLTVLVWACATVLGAMLTLGTRIPAHLAFFGIGLGLISQGMARSGHRAGAWLQFLLTILFVMLPAIPAQWMALLAMPPVLVVLTMLMLALGAYTLDMMFAQGGERHFSLRKAQKQATGQVGKEGQFKAAHVPRVGAWLYGAALRRDVARRHGGALLMHVLGPAVHWTQRCLALLAIVGGAAVAMALLREQASASTLATIAGGSWVGISWALIFQLGDHERRLARVAATHGEQSLVRLAPLMPGAADAFNRRLAARMLGNGLIDWAGTSAMVLALVAISGASGTTLWMQACMCCLTLPMLASTLRDYARDTRSGSGVWGLFLWLLVSFGVCFLAGAVAGYLLGTPVLPLAALASTVLALVAVSWRWRRLRGTSHAFPAGRLA
jgi:hypothetical protein